MSNTRLLGWLLVLAISACAITLVSGMGIALSYLEGTSGTLLPGLTLQHLRPIHDTFAFAWIFLGNTAILYFFLIRKYGPLSPAARRRLVLQIGLWSIAGTGILVTLLGGRFTGREYQGYHPVFSTLIVIGWILFAWNFFERVGWRFRGRAVYICMWSVALPFFVITYLESHFYLIRLISEMPVRDLAIQWKSNGTLVGSFNLLTYGSIIWLSGELRCDDSYAYSRTAFALFTVGLLNTFTNYGHHTFHLPQSPLIHWISFLVSMTEVIILAKLFLDLWGLKKATDCTTCLRASDLFLRFAAVWTFFMIMIGILISIPPLNALIHGTHVVVVHAMGSMLGINSMVMWAGLAYVLRHLTGPEYFVARYRRFRFLAFNISLYLVGFLLSLLARGIAAGWERTLGPSSPDFSLLFRYFPFALALFGFGLALTVLFLLGDWLLALRPILRAPRLEAQPESGPGHEERHA